MDFESQMIDKLSYSAETKVLQKSKSTSHDVMLFVPELFTQILSPFLHGLDMLFHCLMCFLGFLQKNLLLFQLVPIRGSIAFPFQGVDALLFSFQFLLLSHDGYICLS